MAEDGGRRVICEFDCERCGKRTRTRRSPANTPRPPRFCSHSCYSAARAAATLVAKKQKPNVFFSCESREKSVSTYRSPSAIQSHQPRFCSVQCTGVAQRGEGNPAWAGGTRRHAGGYIWIYIPSHPNADVRGCVLEHRLVMEVVAGRPLRREEVVHHVNRVRDDNCPANLRLLPNQAAHSRLHREEDAACTA